jgi:PIN domain nuclease of toxin-antitoxin system
VRVLLDTQIFIVLSQKGVEDFSARIRRLVEDEDSDLLLSAVSITEIAVKTSIKKLAITRTDVSRAAEDLRLTLIPFEPRHAIRMFELPLHHRDPFDRMLIATALSESVPIITGDAEFKEYRGLKVIS